MFDGLYLTIERLPMEGIHSLYSGRKKMFHKEESFKILKVNGAPLQPR
jgi:hypothetical protein